MRPRLKRNFLTTTKTNPKSSCQLKDNSKKLKRNCKHLRLKQRDCSLTSKSLWKRHSKGSSKKPMQRRSESLLPTKRHPTSLSKPNSNFKSMSKRLPSLSSEAQKLEKDMQILQARAMFQTKKPLMAKLPRNLAN